MQDTLVMPLLRVVPSVQQVVIPALLVIVIHVRPVLLDIIVQPLVLQTIPTVIHVLRVITLPRVV